jgi:hypothetical protein
MPQPKMLTQREHSEQELMIVYHALLMAQKALGPEGKDATLQARLIGMRQALEAACKLMAEDTEEEWTVIRARMLSEARKVFSNDAVTSTRQWRTRRTA